MKLASSPGMLLMGIWLILVGGLPLMNMSLPPALLNLIAVAAGALILMDK